jgi:hypothetical protein
MNGNDIFLDQLQLARRWKLSHRTLERWRWLGHGPSYTKLGRRVVYRLVDVERFEAAGLHAPVPLEVARRG